MKVSKVLLRWYKSFNVNTMGYDDRGKEDQPRPWNTLPGPHGEASYPFIEIPLERDVTTIVGANESGKSHLISAISKVITGCGIPDDRDRSAAFDRMDLCHFASQRSRNADRWPNIGLQFTDLTPIERGHFSTLAESVSPAAKGTFAEGDVTLVLARVESTVAYAFGDLQAEPIPLNQDQLDEIRKHLPTVLFIKSDVGLRDEIPLASLLEAYGVTAGSNTVFSPRAAQHAARYLLNLANSSGTIDPKSTEWREAARLLLPDEATLGPDSLEVKLFREILGITADTLECVARASDSNRSYVDNIVADWNRAIDETLTLSRYWQQDDAFALELDYKQGALYLEVRDRTGAVYTFGERSSGLRYFLSYYLQAKALAMAARDKHAIILMDEPDSYLSLLGQRNLLAVFESLVSAETSPGMTQLVYTTHSPFLINRNYPRRIRLVRKGYADEGTQHVSKPMVRSYEPIRSALGIDLAQTLFMGAANVLLEGVVDQYLLSELVRLFATPDTIHELLDLNTIVLSAAGKASAIEQVLKASRWPDEPSPATVVLVDSDQAGAALRERIAQGQPKPLLEDEFVLDIGALLGGDPSRQTIVTIEDLIPVPIYADALLGFIQQWYPAVWATHEGSLRKACKAPAQTQNGIVAWAKEMLASCGIAETIALDKLGIARTVVARATTLRDQHPDAVDLVELKRRLQVVCQRVGEVVDKAQRTLKRQTVRQMLQRAVWEFRQRFRTAGSTFDLEALMRRLRSEVETLGTDGEQLHQVLNRRLNEVQGLRSAGIALIGGADWAQWTAFLQELERSPLAMTVADNGPSVEPSTAPEAASGVNGGSSLEADTPPETASAEPGE